MVLEIQDGRVIGILPQQFTVFNRVGPEEVKRNPSYRNPQHVEQYCVPAFDRAVDKVVPKNRCSERD